MFLHCPHFAFDLRLLTSPLRDVPSQIAVVSQDCVLFARSVRENIKYGYEDASDEEMIRAARLANAHDFVMAQADGYDRGLKPGSASLHWILMCGPPQGILLLL